MKKRWFIIAVLCPLFSLAQGNEKVEIAIISSVGFATGESTAKPLYQFSTGFAIGRWFAGLGGGFDQYKFNSFPVFADWRMSFGKGKPGFLYANIGYNFPARGLQNSSIDTFFKESDRFYGGFYMDAGLGYRFKLGRLHRLLFSAGYSQKKLDNKVEYRNFWPCAPDPCDPNLYEFRYNLGRVVAKLSWTFGRW